MKSTPRWIVAVSAAAMLAFATPAYAASDPARTQQWALTQIKADQAWSVSSGAGVTIAVVDTGIDLTHPDLKSKIVSHYDCTGGKCRTGGSDDNGHGTHVAGIAAAATGNGVGIAGVAPAAKLMAVKVLDSSGSGDCGDIALGIHWAADHGARVINLSLGPELPGILATMLQSGCITDLEHAATYAWNKGDFVVIAAGNDRLQAAYSSSALEVVGATGPDDRPASYSSSGADVYAPGGDAPVSCKSSTCILSTWNDGGYALEQGTSMATPHVSGIAALLFARGYSNTQIRQRLAGTADKVNGVLRVNATRAVGPATFAPPTALPRTYSFDPSQVPSRSYGGVPQLRAAVPHASPAAPGGFAVGPAQQGAPVDSAAEQRSSAAWIAGLAAIGAAIAGGVVLKRTGRARAAPPA
jgi:serine protease